jgi:homoserine kinase type II
MGESLALMHVALKDYEVKRQHAHGENWWLAVANHWKEKLPVPDKVLLETVLQRYRECALNTLPQGLIHGDLFRDNVLFEDERVSGILDFSECGQDFWLLDIAITSNDFCRQWPSDKPDAKRLQRFLHGYSRIRPLSTIEQNALPVFQAVAAMRFWLSRLDVQARNQAEGRMGEHVLEKDPNEMRELLRGFLG